MAGTRRSEGADERDALLVGLALGFALGVIVGAWLV